MKSQIDRIWTRFSRIGLHADENLIEFRQAILVNRLILLFILVMAVYVPFELVVGDFKTALPLALLMISVLAAMLFQHLRIFRFNTYFIYFVSMAYVIYAGIMTGWETYNFVIFLPVILFAVIIFRTNSERIFIFLATLILYLIQQKLYQVVPPQLGLTVEVKSFLAKALFFLSGLLTFIVGYYFMNVNNEYEKIITLQKEKIEERNREITDSIKYAKRIQTAILPPEKLVNRCLGESFILYRPKDIVAGDFFWLEERNGLVFIAAADCTGHGVPGAVVSVVCHNALNRAVREFNLDDPGRLLDKTREIVISEFAKSNEEVKDGMDISICVLDRVQMKMTWSGANNPLWLIREGVLTEVPADKQPIGLHEVMKPFTGHHIDLSAGLCIYLFTDGFQDQFGGEKGKKFKASRLREILCKIYDKPMAAQLSVLENELDSWKGMHDQVDDITVIGMRI